jgi:hypothetical protein
MASPRETSLCNLGFQRAKGIMDQSDKIPFHRLLPIEIVKEDIVPLDGTCLRDKTNKTRICAAVG